MSSAVRRVAAGPRPLSLRTRSIARPYRRGLRDPLTLLAISVALPITVGELLTGATEWQLGAAITAMYLVIQYAASLVGDRSGRGRWATMFRLIAALGYVTVAAAVLGIAAPAKPIEILYLPVVALAASLGAAEAVVIGIFALGLVAIPVMADPARTVVAVRLSFALIASGIVLVLGVRSTVSSLENAMRRLRALVVSNHRRAREMRAIEAVGSVLAAGQSDDVLDRVVDVLVQAFGYRYVTVYLREGGRLRLAAQHGYEVPIADVPLDRGVVGRVARTGIRAFVQDVRSDPDYVAGMPDVASEICVPLRDETEVFGVINVEAVPPAPLHSSDDTTLALVADRVATAFVLGRDRRQLTERAAIFERLAAFSTRITAAREPESLYRAIVRGAAEVIPSDLTTLVVRDRATGAYRIVATHNGDENIVGMEVPVGAGLAGRAIAERRILHADRFERHDFAEPFRSARVPDTLSSVAAPLVAEDVVVGAVSLARTDLDRPLSSAERQILPVLAAQVALAISNALLTSDLTNAAVRDPLTGLFNRRHLDASLARLIAARDRTPPDDRRPLAVILFDLDLFGAFNKQHGHQVGDAVLRLFGSILSRRFRASDLVARYGGEEFIAVLDGASRDQAARIAEEIRFEFASVPIPGPGGEVLHATVSAGCAAADQGTQTMEALLEIADVGLAMAKRAGRNRVIAA